MYHKVSKMFAIQEDKKILTLWMWEELVDVLNIATLTSIFVHIHVSVEATGPRCQCQQTSGLSYRECYAYDTPSP
jgi:hypothetical protein